MSTITTAIAITTILPFFCQNCSGLPCVTGWVLDLFSSGCLTMLAISVCKFLVAVSVSVYDKRIILLLINIFKHFAVIWPWRFFSELNSGLNGIVHAFVYRCDLFCRRELFCCYGL